MKQAIASLLCAAALNPFAAFAQEGTPKPPAPVATPAPEIDAGAMAILKKSADTMLALKTFRADCYETAVFERDPSGKSRPNQYRMSTVVAAKPNRMRYDTWTMNAPRNDGNFAVWKRTKASPEIVFASNGTILWQQFGDIYRESDKTSAEYLNTIGEPWEGFYTANSSPHSSLRYRQSQNNLLSLRLEKPETVANILCDVISYRITSEYGGTTIVAQARLFVGRDGVVRRRTEAIRFGDKPGYVRDSWIRNIALNAPVKSPRTTFAYTPPKGVKKEKPTPVAEREEPPLLANGTVAPDFSATDIDGKPVKLSDLRGNVVVVDFWASWCPPCVASMPHNQAVMKKLQAEGLPVVLLAVDNSEPRPPFEKWVKDHSQMDALRFVHADPKAGISNGLYKVSGIPTQYIVDANGRIRWSTVGFGGESDDLEKAIRAALAAKP
ncbi:MAG: TlpA family protein disulfide reductase [Armatimonadetes bacterium]|nr:TlpA family protein disulfide reductase [Armatimonadota bacterium]